MSFDSAPEDKPLLPNRELLEFVLGCLERGDALDWNKLGQEGLDGIGDHQEFEQAVGRYQELLDEVRSARGQPFLAPGECLGDFEVVDLLARGGMGEVYRAKQRSLGGRLVALKVLRKDQRSPADLDRFQREAMLLSGLHHPNVAEVYGIGESGPYLFLAMRLIPGDSLSRRIRSHKEPTAPGLAVAWSIDVARALTAVHAMGLVHRDVKPSNVVLEPGSRGTERAVLVDFGLARPVQGLSRTTHGVAPLTAAYAAPEQLLGSPVDERADVFSLGALLHDLLTGNKPENRGRAASGLPALSQSKIINSDLCAVVAMATQPDPKKRYQLSSDFLKDLETWQAGLPVQARRYGGRERVYNYLHRHRFSILQWGWRGVLIVVIVSILGWTRAIFQRGGVVRAAATARDLPTLRTAYAGIPALLGAFVLRDDRAYELARRVSGSDGLDPLEGIADAYANGHPEEALELAAAQVAAVGIRGDPLALDLLLHTLRNPESPEDRERAFLLLALALNQKPDTHRVASAESDSIMELIRPGLFSDATSLRLEGKEKLYALTILGAIGREEEAKRLAEEWVSFPPGSELMRLSAESLERMLRRSYFMGREAEILDQVPWIPLLERIRHLREAGLHGDWGYQVALVRLTSAYLLACRRVGFEANADLALPSSWLAADPIQWKGIGCYAPINELAAAGDPRAMMFSDAIRSSKKAALSGYHLGRIAGLYDDADLIQQAVTKLVDVGIEPNKARDLIMPSYREAQLELTEAWSGADAFQDGGLDPLDENNTPLRTLPFQYIGEYASASLVKPTAAWELTSCDPPCLYGEATGLAVVAAGLFRENGARPTLLLSTFGKSEVVLEIDHAQSEKQEWSLSVHGQVSSHRYLPYQGIVRLELFLDGLWIGALSLSHVELRLDTFQIPAYWLSEGRHKLRILLGNNSTTSYRLFSAKFSENSASQE